MIRSGFLIITFFYWIQMPLGDGSRATTKPETAVGAARLADFLVNAIGWPEFTFSHGQEYT